MEHLEKNCSVIIIAQNGGMSLVTPPMVYLYNFKEKDGIIMAIKYLLTGAAGNLGSSIVKELIAQGKDIRALVLSGDKSAQHIPAGVEICWGNILNHDDLNRFFKVPEGTEIIVIHSAGIVSTVWNYVKLVYDVNVQGTRNILEHCIRLCVKRLVYIGSVHAIPELPKGQTITEISEFDPDKIIGYYGKTKAEAARIVMEAVKEQGLDAVLIFPAGLCGPYDYNIGYFSQLLIDCSKSKLPGGIEGGYNFVDVRDVAAGVVSACERGGKGEGYILGNRYVSVREILKLVHEQTGAKLVKHMFPIWLAHMLVPFFGIYYKAKKRLPLFTSYSLYTLTSNSDYSIEKARRELGYSVRPFEETIADALKWLKVERKL